jgi:hypothetical protein
LLAQLAALEPVGEASLADAIDGLAAGFGEGDGPRSSRLIVLTDLSGDCGGSLCGALAGVVAQGARVELVVFGESRIPACVGDLEVARAWPLAAAAVPFRVESSGAAAATAGIADGRAVSIPAGSVQIVVDLDPPEVFGPVEIPPGTEGRLRILDFPRLEPPVRERTWNVGAAPVADGEGDASDGP